MQRLYSMFPEGSAGAALFLLRLSVAGTYLNLALSRASGSCLVWSGWVHFPVVILLALGLMTPLCSSVCCLYELAVLVTCTDMANAPCLLGIAIAVALIFLGPGAYSVDSILFGRRVIRVPFDDDPRL
jgi:uncharacterized membrane protein YphA (DoxX/SURF4 family)